MASKHFTLLLVALTIVAVIFISGCAGQGGDTTKKNSGEYPACPEELSGLLTVSMIDVNQIAAIEPLGAVNGQDHMLPVDHVYYNSNINADPISTILPVYAPADITITKIAKHQNFEADGTPQSGPEFMIDFVVCDGITLWVEGIHTLSPALEEIYNKSEKSYNEGPLNQGAKATNYDIQLAYAAKAGEIIAWTGGVNERDSIAVTAFNENIKQLEGVNYNYYPERLRTAFCYIDLYSGDLKKSIENKFGDYNMQSKNGVNGAEGYTATFTPRTQEPKCGEIIQTIPGTIQGDWFYGSPSIKDNGENLESEGKTLSFLHKNTNPSYAIISIGGNFMKTGAMEFVPNHSGFINREPSEVTADGNVYCYNPQEGLWSIMEGKILVQLTDSNHLKVEHQDGSCTGSETFTSPFTYQR